MMKRLLTIIACTALLFGCKYDDGEVWKRIDDLAARVEAIEKQLEPLNLEVRSLRTIVDALSSGYVIMDTRQTENGYVITFSNEKTITITHGANGVNAPVIGVKPDGDGRYCWTLDGEFYMPDGQTKLPVTGDKGEAGAAGATPVIGVDAQGYWTVDTGSGPQRILSDGEPVSALGPKGETGDKGERGDSLFEAVRPGETSVTFVLAGGQEITVPRIEASVKLSFADPDDIRLYWGESATLDIEAEGIRSALITCPCDWSASVNITARRVKVSAPGLHSSEAEQSGFISIIAVTDAGHTITLSKAVATTSSVPDMAKVNTLLSDIIAKELDEEAPVALTFDIEAPKSDYTNLSIPAGFTAAAIPSITVNFNGGITTSAAMGAYNSTYDGELIASMPRGAAAKYISIQLPRGSARISGGTHTQAQVQTKDAAIVEAGTNIEKMSVTGGHLINFGTIGDMTLQWSGVTDPEVQILNYSKITGSITETNGRAAVIEARPRSAGSSKWISKVMEYRPAPGQFTNMQITWSLPENIRNIEGGRSTTTGLSLGAFGGSVTFRFDHTVPNLGGDDFCILGNAFATSNEPGAVMVAMDRNGNGVPDDDEWYEIRGSLYDDPATVRDYEITYRRPEDLTTKQPIEWTDNRGGSGTMPAGFYNRTYWPTGLEGETITYRGNRIDVKSTGTILEYGYADNFSADYNLTVGGDADTKGSNKFDISRAVDSEGNGVYLLAIDFIRVYNPVYSVTAFGEISPEVCGAISLHLGAIPSTASGTQNWNNGTINIR